MSVDAATVAALLRMPVSEATSLPLQALVTVEQVLAYTASQARAEGLDECDQVELVIRAANELASSVRRSAAILRRLGFIAVADRMVEIAGRRKHGLKPLP